MSWSRSNRIAFGLVVIIMAAGNAVGVDTYPLQGLAPGQKIGGLVSIPGSPLPPVPERSVRTAIKLYEPLLAGLRLFGDTEVLARGCGYLATLYAAVREIPKAERLFDEAERILEKNGVTGRDLAWLHNNHGLVQVEDGQYAAGLRSFRTALSNLESNREELLEPRVVALQNLAATYSLLGDAENSEGAYLDALELLRRLKKEGSPPHQTTRANLATLYVTMGDFVDARKILHKLVVERPLSQPLRFQVLCNLGYVLSVLREFPAAKARLLQARSLAADGSAQHALVAMNLAAMYSWAGDFERAEDVGQEALRLTRELYGADSRVAAAATVNLAVTALSRGELLKADRLLVQARSILSKETGDQEVFVFATRALALVAQRRGQRERAIELSREALELAKQHLERILAFGSEAQRLAYQSQASPYDQLANLGDPVLLADAVLTMKGAVLDSLLVERALVRKSTSAADQEQLDRINALKVEIMEKIGRGDPELEMLERALKKAETGLAKKLAPRLRRSQSRTSLRVVQAALESDQVLIEIIRFQRYEQGGKLIAAYGAMVIPSKGLPSWVSLGDSEVVEDWIADLVGRFAVGSRGVKVIEEGSNDVVLTLRELNDRLWEPVAKVIPAGTKRVLLSPDAATCFLPWTILLDENKRFLAERWQLTQIGAGRDLLRTATATPANTLLALADGNGDLPYSRMEVEEIARAAEQRGWRVTARIGEQATEIELFQRPRPGILHLATHGAQLQEDLAQPIESRLSRNPMYRGYLLLAGGQETLERWKSGSAVPFAADGILTAEEASALDLSETWLTVLSACETGAGDVRTGEGVLGLRRGFLLAGTKHLLFSLWSVSDDATAEFMKAFYRQLLQSRDPVRAFHETQVAELLRWRKTGGITSAVYRAGGFVFTRSAE